MTIYETEWNKVKPCRLKIAVVTFATQLLSLFFFTVIGLIEEPGGDNIFKSYSGIAGIASAVTICVLMIYGAVILNRFLVINYIGDNRMRLYLYPVGRKHLYLIKSLAFIKLFLFAYIVGELLAFCAYFLFEIPINMTGAVSTLAGHIVFFALLSLSTPLLTTALIMLAGIIGIAFSSTVATIVASVSLTAITANIIAVSIMYNVYITFLSALCVSAAVCALVFIRSTIIEKEDVV